MPKIVYMTNNGHQDHHEFHIHAEGCADVTRGVRNHTYDPGDARYPIEVESVEDFIDSEVQVYEDQEQGWTAEDFRVFPCAEKGA